MASMNQIIAFAVCNCLIKELREIDSSLTVSVPAVLSMRSVRTEHPKLSVRQNITHYIEAANHAPSV